MWRYKPEWDEAKRRVDEGIVYVSSTSTLDESLVRQFVSQMKADIKPETEEMVGHCPTYFRTPLPKNLPLMDVRIIDKAIITWGPEKQCTQLVEECGEYITEAMHLLFRPDRTNDLPHFLEEVVGVRIAVDHVIRLYQEECEKIYVEQIGKELDAMKKSCDKQGIPYDLD